MNNSAAIRKENKKTIYRFMLDGKPYTKQQVSVGTGLSVATCNTLLNDMQSRGILAGGEKLAGEVGRSSTLYQIRDDHESYLAVYFYMEQGRRWIETVVFSAIGKVLSRERQTVEYVSDRQIEELADRAIRQYPHTSQIIVGTPGIAEHGIIKYCDIPELEDVPLKGRLQGRFGVEVSMENDMHYKAYGYYKKNGNPDEVITLGYFPAHILPGTVTIHKGTIIRGANSFAGMTGFLPYNISRKEQLAKLEPGTCIPFITQALCAVIVLLNPGLVVLTGSLIDEGMLETVRQRCGADIPREYMPEFRIVDSFEQYYCEGMYQTAVDKKEI